MCSQVVVRCQAVLAQEHVGIAKVTEGSPSSSQVIQTFCNRETLCMWVWGSGAWEVSCGCGGVGHGRCGCGEWDVGSGRCGGRVWGVRVWEVWE